MLLSFSGCTASQTQHLQALLVSSLSFTELKVSSCVPCAPVLRAAGPEGTLARAAAPKPETLQQRTALRMAIPSKGRMAEDTLKLLQDCQLSVYKPNPRQYTAVISQVCTLKCNLCIRRCASS